MSIKLLYIGFFITLLFPFQYALADVFINEVMYDLPGNDDKGEWIELFNSGDQPVNLEGWNIETSSNHRPFSLVLGSFVLSPGGYALIIQDEEQKRQWPYFTLLKSSFSLTNTSGKVVLKNGEEIVDTFSYSKEQGGEGDGNSLQKFNGVFVSSPPTAGSENVFVIPQPKVEPVVSVVEEKFEVDVAKIESRKELEEIKEDGTAKSIEPIYFSVKETIPEGESLVKWLIALSSLLVFSSLGVFLFFKKDELDDIKIIVEE